MKEKMQELIEKSILLIILSMSQKKNAFNNSLKGYIQKVFTKDNTLEFHVDNLDAFTEIVKDWPLKGVISACKNPTAKINIVFD